MLKDHPTVEDLEAFLRSASGPGMATRNARILLHLLAECSVCRHQLRDTGWSEQRLEHLLCIPVDRDEHGAIGTVAPYDYSHTFVATKQALDDFFAQEQWFEHTPGKLLAELASLPHEEQARWVSTYPRFASPPLIRSLVEMSHASRYEDPIRLLHLANLARLASEACTVTAAGSAGKLADLRAQGWRQYGNALRISGRMREAEEAFDRAQRFCDEGTGDPPLRAWLLEQIVSLRIFQRRFEHAIVLADKASRIYRELGETRSAASAMVQKSIAQLLSGAPEAAVSTLNRVIPLIDQDGDPHLLFAACHNLVRAYIEMGKPEQALSLYFEARAVYQEVQDPLIALRAGWQEGQILRDLGYLRAAEAALLRTRRGLAEKELPYEVAVVSLDLADVYLRLGEIEKLRQTTSEMVPIFKALEVDRDMLVALLQLQKADRQSRKTSELIRFLSSRLEELPHQS